MIVPVFTILHVDPKRTPSWIPLYWIRSMTNRELKYVTLLVSGWKSLGRTGCLNQMSSPLCALVEDHTDIFCTNLSSGPPEDVKPLRIYLQEDARSAHVRLCNYSQKQRDCLYDLVHQPVRPSLAYSKPTSKWASAPLVLPRLGPSKFCFTVELRPFNTYTRQYHYPMAILEQ